MSRRFVDCRWLWFGTSRHLAKCCLFRYGLLGGVIGNRISQEGCVRYGSEELRRWPRVATGYTGQPLADGLIGCAHGD